MHFRFCLDSDQIPPPQIYIYIYIYKTIVISLAPAKADIRARKKLLQKTGYVLTLTYHTISYHIISFRTQDRLNVHYQFGDCNRSCSVQHTYTHRSTHKYIKSFTLPTLLIYNNISVFISVLVSPTS